MIDRILTIINGPIYRGCYITAEYERRQLIAAAVGYGVTCFGLGVAVAAAFAPVTNM